jgi:hypothetical protein
MKAYPYRALSLAITLSLGVSLIGAVLVWSDTGVQVSVDDYFEHNAFQMLIDNPPGQSEAVDQAEAFANTDLFVESTYRVNSVVGLVYGTELPNSTVYGLDEPIYTYGLKDCEVILADDTFLDITASEFTVEGTFNIHEGEVLISQQFVTYVYEVFGLTMTINSSFGVEVLTQRPVGGDAAPIGELGRMSLESLKIVGIYEVEGFNSIVELGFPSLLRSSYENFNYDLPVLGIRDSIIIKAESLGSVEDTISEQGFFGARTFIRASGDALIDGGLDAISVNLLTLKARIDERYVVNVEGLEEIEHLQGLIDTYSETILLSLLNLPIFILALFLSVFAADTFMAARNTEVSALRSKGASSSQIYGIFIAESLLMAVMSLGLGLVLSIVFAALIPSTVSFMSFDFEVYSFYLSSTVLRPETILNTVLICILPPLLFILNSARKAAHSEIGSYLMEVSEPMGTEGEAHGFTIGASIALLVMVALSVLFLPTSPSMLLVELGLGTAAWFFLAYNGSRISRVGFSRITARLSFMLGEKNRISAGNLRMRKGRVVPLMVVLALTLSSTIAFTVQAESFQADLEKEVRYAIGADLRVSTTARPFSFNNTLEEYPGVNRAVPVLTTWASLGTERITIEALDPTEYSLIGHFDESSFYGEDANFMLSRLHATPNGIILSAYHASRWNKTIGDILNLEVGGRLTPVTAEFVLVGLVRSAPGFGYASALDIPYSRLGAGFGYQAGHQGFAITNLDFVSSVTEITTARVFLADLVCITDQELVLRALSDIPGVSATTPEAFDLPGFSFGTALFLSTVEGLFSIGFAMSFLLSMFALTLFLGSVVRERKRDYAILRAVGGSKKQIVRVVLSEFAGIVFASLILSLILGTVFGYVMSAIIFSMSPFARTLGVAVTFPIGFLTAVLLVEIGAMIAGAYLPAREASKTDPAIVLRNL